MTRAREPRPLSGVGDGWASDGSDAHDPPQNNGKSDQRREPVRLPPMVRQSAAEAADHWARRIWGNARRERRRTSGGWPGTLTEARSLVAGKLLPSLQPDGLRELAGVDRDQLARYLYRTARESWLRLQQQDVGGTA